MKKIIIITFLLLIVIGFTACSTPKEVVDEPLDPVGNNDVEEVDRPKIMVVATLFPQYDFARSIGGEFAQIDLLLPPGIEAHSYEPTPQEMVKLLKSDLFLFTGDLMEPWTKNIVNNLEEEDVVVVDLSENMVLMQVKEDDHDHGDESLDPHYWTDPNMALLMVDSIVDAFVNLDPENESVYSSNGDKLKIELNKLDTDIGGALAKTESKTIISGGHFAFGYFAKAYGLSHMSPYNGFSPNAEPTPQSITSLINKVKETKVNAIYYEELIDPKVARTIIEETGVDMLLLHGVHNISKEELESGITYIDIMYQNLENLKLGLGYNE